MSELSHEVVAEPVDREVSGAGLDDPEILAVNEEYSHGPGDVDSDEPAESLSDASDRLLTQNPVVDGKTEESGADVVPETVKRPYPSTDPDSHTANEACTEDPDGRDGVVASDEADYGGSLDGATDRVEAEPVEVAEPVATHSVDRDPVAELARVDEVDQAVVAQPAEDVVASPDEVATDPVPTEVVAEDTQSQSDPRVVRDPSGRLTELAEEIDFRERWSRDSEGLDGLRQEFTAHRDNELATEDVKLETTRLEAEAAEVLATAKDELIELTGQIQRMQREETDTTAEMARFKKLYIQVNGEFPGDGDDASITEDTNSAESDVETEPQTAEQIQEAADTSLLSELAREYNRIGQSGADTTDINREYGIVYRRLEAARTEKNRAIELELEEARLTKPMSEAEAQEAADVLQLEELRQRYNQEWSAGSDTAVVERLYDEVYDRIEAAKAAKLAETDPSKEVKDLISAVRIPANTEVHEPDIDSRDFPEYWQQRVTDRASALASEPGGAMRHEIAPVLPVLAQVKYLSPVGVRVSKGSEPDRVVKLSGLLPDRVESGRLSFTAFNSAMWRSKVDHLVVKFGDVVDREKSPSHVLFTPGESGKVAGSGATITIDPRTIHERMITEIDRVRDKHDIYDSNKIYTEILNDVIRQSFAQLSNRRPSATDISNGGHRGNNPLRIGAQMNRLIAKFDKATFFWPSLNYNSHLNR